MNSDKVRIDKKTAYFKVMTEYWAGGKHENPVKIATNLSV
jgi:hypothetical protein